MNRVHSYYPFPEEELMERIAKNRSRMCDPYYSMEEVFMPPQYDWPGDKEGRALLAFACHAKIGGEPIACMHTMVEALPDRTNPHGYFGSDSGRVIDEQQLSGHSWYLRGLCEYIELTDSLIARRLLTQTVSHLFLPLRGRIATYPLGARRDAGGVSGSASKDLSGEWRLSSDVGCAFMSIDGLAHAYELLKDESILSLLREMVTVFDAIDKIAIRAQTHCSLTAARGILRLYQLTEDPFYLSCACRIADLYLESGMTLTYQNMNWWGRPDSWTEPCAIVDSLMVCGELYKATQKDHYRLAAVRIAHNGLATAQRENGGAGCESVVIPGQGILRMVMEEAPFCCSMRLAEGLRYIKENQDLLKATLSDALSLDEYGRLQRGDLLYIPLDETWEAYADSSMILTYNGVHYAPIPKFYKIPLAVSCNLALRILPEKL